MKRSMLRMVASARLLVCVFAVLAGCDSVWGLERPPDPPPVPGEWANVTSGLLHACAIQTDGSLWCWGENQYGRLGLGTGRELEVTKPSRVGDATWTAVGGGNEHTCGIHADQTLWCWGNNENGQLGDTTRLVREEPVPIGPEHWKVLGVGDFTTCAIRADDSLWCWGLNAVGQVGDGTTTDRTEPTLVDATRTWTSVSVSRTHSCALTDDLQIWCWGAGPFPASSGPAQLTPVRLEPGVEWTAVQTMIGTTCGITVGEVRCWGSNAAGQLGDGTTTDRDGAAPIASDRTDFVRLQARTRTACAFTADDAMVCWGENRRGQLGSDTATPIQSVPYEQDGTWKRYAPGLMHACAIDGNAHLACTGGNGRGQRGDGTGGSVLSPVAIPGRWTSVAASEVHTCAISGDTQRSSCWGANDSGELGDGSVITRQVPTQVSLVATASKLALGRRHTCEVTGAGKLFCWGDNGDSQLASSPRALELVPFPITASATNVSAVAAFDQTCAADAAGTGYCWGMNATGQLGRGTVSPASPLVQPVMYAGANAPLFSTLSAGSGFTCGTTTGFAYCWGANRRGQLGVLDTVARLKATPLANLNAVSLDAGASHACAIDNNDALYCWGDNASGQLGVGPNDDMRTDPTRVGAAQWSSVSAGESHTCAIQRNDGSLWCWGTNARGALGIGSRTPVDGPVQVGTAKWRAVSAGADYTCGIQTVDESLWCWGVSDWGQLGTGTAWSSRFVEIAVP